MLADAERLAATPVDLKGTGAEVAAALKARQAGEAAVAALRASLMPEDSDG